FPAAPAAPAARGGGAPGAGPQSGGAGPDGRAAAPAPAGARAGGPGGANQPIVLVRNGKEHRITGNQSNVRAGTEMQVLTERPEVSLSVSEMDKDSWLIFELPGFSNADSGTELGSLDALRGASETSYFRGEDALWVKLVVPTDPELPIRPTVMQESITVSR